MHDSRCLYRLVLAALIAARLLRDPLRVLLHDSRWWWIAAVTLMDSHFPRGAALPPPPRMTGAGWEVVDAGAHSSKMLPPSSGMGRSSSGVGPSMLDSSCSFTSPTNLSSYQASTGPSLTSRCLLSLLVCFWCAVAYQQVFRLWLCYSLLSWCAVACQQVHTQVQCCALLSLWLFSYFGPNLAMLSLSLCCRSRCATAHYHQLAHTSSLSLWLCCRSRCATVYELLIAADCFDCSWTPFHLVSL